MACSLTSSNLPPSRSLSQNIDSYFPRSRSDDFFNISSVSLPIRSKTSTIHSFHRDLDLPPSLPRRSDRLFSISSVRSNQTRRRTDLSLFKGLGFQIDLVWSTSKDEDQVESGPHFEEDAVDAAIKSGKLNPSSGCVTSNLRIGGGDGWDPASFTVLAQQYKRMKKTYGGKVVPGVMDSTTAKHLAHVYGTRAEQAGASRC